MALFLHRSTTLSTSDAFTSVITVLVPSTKETKDGFKIQIEQLPLKDKIGSSAIIIDFRINCDFMSLLLNRFSITG